MKDEKESRDMKKKRRISISTRTIFFFLPFSFPTKTTRKSGQELCKMKLLNIMEIKKFFQTLRGLYMYILNNDVIN